MQKISGAIRQGAEAFLRRQNLTIAKIAVPLAMLIYILYGFVREPNVHDPAGKGALALWTTLSFVLGAVCSLIAGYVGMWISIRTNVRTAAAARTSLNGALQTALRGGAVSGLLVVGMSLLGVGGLYAVAKAMGATVKATQIPLLIVGLRLRRLASSRCSPRWAAASTRRPPTSAPTSSARSRRASPRTTRATRP